MSSTTKKQFVAGVAYTAVSKYAGQLIQLVISAILSRILAPEAFGIILTSTVIISFFAIFSEMGLSAAVIQFKDLSKRDLENFFSFTFWVGIVFSVLFYFCSPLIASYYQSPVLVPICRILSVNLLFSSAINIPNALMLRDKKFKFIAIRTLAIQVVTGVIAIVTAYNLTADMKIYSLVMQSVASTVLLFAVTYSVHPIRLRFTFGLDSIRKVLSYSAYQFMFSFINFFSRSFDKLIIGKYLGMSHAGYYEKSYKLMLQPLNNITNVLTPVMHPVFSDLKNDLKRLLSSYMTVIKLLAVIGFPASVLLIFCAEELMLLVFGPQWGPSVPVFKIFAVSIGVQMLLSSTGSIFQAAGDTRTMFIVGFVAAVLNISGMFISLLIFKTMEALAWGIVITFTINFIQCFVTMYRVTFKAPMADFWRAFISPLILSLLMLAGLWFTSHLLPPTMDIKFTFIIKCAVGAAIWASFVQLTGVYDLIGQIRSLYNKI